MRTKLVVAIALAVVAAAAAATFLLRDGSDGKRAVVGSDEEAEAVQHEAYEPTIDGGPYEASIEAVVTMPQDLAEGRTERTFTGEGTFDPETGTALITYDFSDVPNGFGPFGHVPEVVAAYQDGGMALTFDGLGEFTDGVEWFGFDLGGFYRPPLMASDKGQMRELALTDPTFALSLLNGVAGDEADVSRAAESSGSEALEVVGSELNVKRVPIEVTAEGNVVREIGYEVAYPPTVDDNPDIVLKVVLTLSPQDSEDLDLPSTDAVVPYEDYLTRDA